MVTAWNIKFDYSSNNQVIGNDILGQGKGYGYCIWMERNSSNNVISGNNFTDAGSAVAIMSGKNNIFYDNNFLNNVNAIVGGNEINFLNSGQIGNFWSNYTGTDGNRDGIGDTPFMVDDGALDNYPLMAPYNFGNGTYELPDWTKSITSEAESTSNYTLIIAVATVAAVIAIVCGAIWFRKSRAPQCK